MQVSGGCTGGSPPSGSGSSRNLGVGSKSAESESGEASDDLTTKKSDEMETGGPG